ncbi:glycosyltransferase family 4 protein [uncultured Maribacter sp.]|uniref:glycosyltransferase n=1 Tax=uncultured Maribacter sp. TaxID=431308 RepID=UPI00262D60DC|nr:glycosyltransferase family 4 protein [uncultured Maribacter sp.]
MTQLKVLIIGFVWPEPTSTAAGQRMLELIQFFLKQNYIVSFACTAKKTKYSFPLDTLGVFEKEIVLNNSNFDSYLNEIKPNIVMFDRFLTEEQFGWRVAENVPNALRILDTEDLHSLRQTRELAFKKDLPFLIADWKKNATTKREIASIYRSDISLLISPYEMRLLKENIKIEDSLIHYLPFLLEKTRYEPIPYTQRKGFICIGNGNHAPNKDAIIWLKKEIWPLIRKQLPEATLSIYGGHLPEQIMQMHNPKEGFLVKGWAPNAIEAVSKAKICLAPLRFGAGIKGKLVTAIQAETPSITTQIGAEGIQLPSFKWNGIIKEDAVALANAAVELYRSEKEWYIAQKNGKKLLQQIFNKEKFENHFLKAITNTLENLKEHRERNFIGAMLQHNSMASTKYMSKWIEAKNRM